MESKSFKRQTCGLCLLLAGILLVAGCVAPAPSELPFAATSTPSPEPRDVVLTLGIWATSLEGMNRVLDAFHADHPNITIQLDLSTSGVYDDVLLAQLQGGTAPDLFYLRSFEASRQLFDAGYLEPLTDLPLLQENFAPAMLAPWSTEKEVPYGVPFTASSHGIYYNQDIFQELGPDIPESWEELLTISQVIKDAGYIPFANGTRDAWTSPEIIFMNIAPNFIGGREGRMAYLSGERCFDDEHILATYQGVADLVPFLPQDHDLLGYVDSLELFTQGKAAMWMSGSWDIPYFEAAEPAFDWNVLAIPAPAGQPTVVPFHLDVGIGLNAASQHKEEAKEFLIWMATPAFGELLGNDIPGFFPMHTEAPVLADPHANAFLALNQGRETDIRFSWEKISEGTPSAYTLIEDGAKRVLLGELSPQEAADALQAGLAQWFLPAQECEQ